MREKVEEILDKIRPALVRDGGNVELVGVDDGTVKVKLVGPSRSSSSAPAPDVPCPP